MGVNTIDKVFYCDYVWFGANDNILNNSKKVDKINIFGSCVRFIFDTGETDKCKPAKNRFYWDYGEKKP